VTLDFQFECTSGERHSPVRPPAGLSASTPPHPPSFAGNSDNRHEGPRSESQNAKIALSISRALNQLHTTLLASRLLSYSYKLDLKPFRIISLYNSQEELPWNHIVTGNLGGWGAVTSELAAEIFDEELRDPIEDVNTRRGIADPVAAASVNLILGIFLGFHQLLGQLHGIGEMHVVVAGGMHD